MDHRSKVLPLPGYNQEEYKITKVSCGFLAMELSRVATGRQEKLTGQKQPVACHVLYAMLPSHMVRSLSEEGFSVDCMENARGKEIRRAIDNGSPALIFTGFGVGHWLTVWGYDKRGFYVFDNRSQAKRDENGLTYMYEANLHKAWRKTPRLLKPVQWLGRIFPKLQVEPYTLVIPQ